MSKNIITRFAPSPTGMLHVGNARTALINYLLAKNLMGKFILRIDDTDKERSRQEFKDKIIEDLTWLGLKWDDIFHQSSRMDIYEAAKDQLIKSGRLYPCYETQAELEIKRKLQLSSGRPPIYDRAALKLSEDEKKKFELDGRKPHYRFLIEHKPIIWNDMVKGRLKYEGKHMSDPILVREDTSMTYMICSTVDDAEYNISHVIRGEDHVSNTAIQMQLFEAMGFEKPEFGHLSLVKSTEDKISKRKGGFEVANLRDKMSIEPMAINSFFASIGTSSPVTYQNNMQNLVDDFDIHKFSKSPTTYMPEELTRLNHKMVSVMNYGEIKPHLSELGADYITESFWLAVRGNVDNAADALAWWKICSEMPEKSDEIDSAFAKSALELLPKGEIDAQSWKSWTSSIKESTGLSGKNLFMPLRLILTGLGSGPEMGTLLPLIGRDAVIERLKHYL
jgi:glutamyl-tRNA synthetase